MLAQLDLLRYWKETTRALFKWWYEWIHDESSISCRDGSMSLMSCFFTEQVLAQLDLLRSWNETALDEHVVVVRRSSISSLYDNVTRATGMRIVEKRASVADTAEIAFPLSGILVQGSCGIFNGTAELEFKHCASDGFAFISLTQP